MKQVPCKAPNVHVKSFAGTCMIVCTERKSHMWDGKTCVHFLNDFLALCLHMQRETLGLDGNSKALLICDRAGCHLSRSFLQMRYSFVVCVFHMVDQRRRLIERAMYTHTMRLRHMYRYKKISHNI